VLKSKDQALDAFVKFKAEAKNVTGEKIKALRSDRGRIPCSNIQRCL